MKRLFSKFTTVEFSSFQESPVLGGEEGNKRNASSWSWCNVYFSGEDTNAWTEFFHRSILDLSVKILTKSYFDIRDFEQNLSAYSPGYRERSILSLCSRHSQSPTHKLLSPSGESSGAAMVNTLTSNTCVSLPAFFGPRNVLPTRGTEQ